LLASSDKIKVQRKQITTLSLMNEANNNAAAVCSAQTVNAPLCEARQGTAQSVGATTQYRINTRKQVAHAACSLDRIASKCRFWGEGSLRRPIENTQLGRLQKLFRAPGNLPRATPVRFGQGFCGGAGPEKQRRVGRQDRHPVRHER
jgi:hypothetical protein